jgi:hypothetical protein
MPRRAESACELEISRTIRVFRHQLRRGDDFYRKEITGEAVLAASIVVLEELRDSVRAMHAANRAVAESLR